MWFCFLCHGGHCCSYYTLRSSFMQNESFLLLLEIKEPVSLQQRGLTRLHVSLTCKYCSISMNKQLQIIPFYLDGLHSINFKVPTSTLLASDTANEICPCFWLTSAFHSLPWLSSFPILWRPSCLFFMWHVNEKSRATARLLAALVDPWPHFIDMRHSYKSHFCLYSVHNCKEVPEVTSCVIFINIHW